MRKSLLRLFATASIVLVAFVSLLLSAGAQDATPIAVVDEAAETATVDMHFALTFCYNSATPGVTDWIYQADFVSSAVSSCLTTDVNENVETVRISIYDGATNELLSEVPLDTSMNWYTTLETGGSIYFVENIHNTTSPVYTVGDGSTITVDILIHEGVLNYTPTVPAAGELNSFRIHSFVCDPNVPDESGKLIVVSQNRLATDEDTDVSLAAEGPSVGCNRPQSNDPDAISLASVGEIFIDGAAGTPTEGLTYGPFASSNFMQVEAGYYTVRFVRASGLVQVSESIFIFPAEGAPTQEIVVIVYTGEPITPTPTATATATSTAVTPGVTPTAGSVTQLPNTGAGQQGSGSSVMLLSVLAILFVGAITIASRTARARR